jgi:dTDP-4-dehydrorhamnose reductase
MRILITGGGGQLAADLVPALANDEVVALAREELDITNRLHVQAAFDGWEPEVVINTAAFHRVDLCEEEPERSFAVNAAAPQRLAAACERRGALLVHISTDYVFAGDQRRPYAEDDPVRPISVYGASKAAGEMAIRCTTDSHIIVRTSGLYGPAGRRTAHGNFPETMLRLVSEGKPIAVVQDQVLTPSYTQDVADVIARLVRLGARGTYHVTNGGECSWHEFARELFCLAGIEADLSPTTQDERPMPARRPAYSVLDHARIAGLGIPEPRPWREALAEYVAKRPKSVQP